ncbi:class I SAM-dependent methyltransferase [Micromonospora sp. STR1s_5]|nr:class I SAM-dependent methyltransferase [Micromonospora sp. STR1s_5]
MRREEAITIYDAPGLYDLLVPPGPCERFYRDLARRTGGPILELACGTGRLTLPLARDGHEVVGLDNSDPMLRAARSKAAEEDLAISFHKGDMRSFDLGTRFALVIVSCNSLCQLTETEDLTSCLRQVAVHLVPGGLLAFDVVNPRVADLARGRTLRIDPNPSRPDVQACEEQIAYDPVQQVRVLQWEVHEGGDAPCRTAPMRLRTIFPQELLLLLEAVGLELATRYGDFDRNPLTGNSLNQVVIARSRHTGHA